MMLTVPDAARRVGKNPETIRRWIRSGRLRSERAGTQHLVDEADLASLVDAAGLDPEAWRTMWDGQPQIEWVTRVRESRASR